MGVYESLGVYSGLWRISEKTIHPVAVRQTLGERRQNAYVLYINSIRNAHVVGVKDHLKALDNFL